MHPKNTTRKRAGEDAVSIDGNGVENRPDEERYVGSRELLRIIPISEMTLWRWVRDERVRFPAPTKLGANGRNFWWLPDIRAWQRRRSQEAA